MGHSSDTVGQPAQKGVELLALVVVERSEQVVFRGGHGTFGAAQQLLAGGAEAQDVAAAVGVVAGALDGPRSARSVAIVAIGRVKRSASASSAWLAWPSS